LRQKERGFSTNGTQSRSDAGKHPELWPVDCRLPRYRDVEDLKEVILLNIQLIKTKITEFLEWLTTLILDWKNSSLGLRGWSLFY
jgi:hypothetical protein